MAFWRSKYIDRTRRSASHLLDILTDVQLSSSLAKINKACDKFENAVKNFEDHIKLLSAPYPKNVLFALDIYQDYERYSEQYKTDLLNQVREAILAHKDARTKPRLLVTLQFLNHFLPLLESVVLQTRKTIMKLYERELTETSVQGFGVLKGKVLLRTIFFLAGDQFSRREIGLFEKVDTTEALRQIRFKRGLSDKVYSHPYFKRALLKSAQLGIQSIDKFYSKLKEIITYGIIKTFESNSDFFLSVYGPYLNLKLTIIITLQESYNVGGFVSSLRKIAMHGSEGPELVEVSFQDPNDVDFC